MTRSLEFQSMASDELLLINGGSLEDMAYAMGVAFGVSGAIISVAAIPFTGGASGAAAITCAGTALYSWGQLID